MNNDHSTDHQPNYGSLDRPEGREIRTERIGDRAWRHVFVQVTESQAIAVDLTNGEVRIGVIYEMQDDVPTNDQFFSRYLVFGIDQRTGLECFIGLHRKKDGTQAQMEQYYSDQTGADS